MRLLREARVRGVKISGEVCPHHIALTDESIQTFDTNFKMNPPLRTQADIDALIGGIADGTITILASDHAPHCGYEKEVEFDAAPFGIVGLETELGTLPRHSRPQKTGDRSCAARRFVHDRTRALIETRSRHAFAGRRADVTLIDPELEWTVKVDQFHSASRNTPFDGWKLKGRAVRTIVGGEDGVGSCSGDR